MHVYVQSIHQLIDICFLSICLSVSLNFYLSVSLYIYHSSTYQLSIHPSLHLPCFSIYLPSLYVHSSIHPSIYLILIITPCIYLLLPVSLYILPSIYVYLSTFCIHLPIYLSIALSRYPCISVLENRKEPKDFFSGFPQRLSKTLPVRFFEGALNSRGIHGLKFQMPLRTWCGGCSIQIPRVVQLLVRSSVCLLRSIISTSEPFHPYIMFIFRASVASQHEKIVECPSQRDRKS